VKLALLCFSTLPCTLLVLRVRWLYLPQSYAAFAVEGSSCVRPLSGSVIIRCVCRFGQSFLGHRILQISEVRGMSGVIRQTNVHWLRELQLHVITTADHRMGLYKFVEMCMGRPEYRQMLPMSWRTSSVPSHYVRTILLYHLLYHSTATEAYIPGVPGLPSNIDAVPEQLDASMKLGHQVEASLHLSAFRRNTARKMASLSCPEHVWNVICWEACFVETILHLHQPAKRRSTLRSAAVMQELMAYVWHPSRMLKLQEAEHEGC